jgi:hypothetical protein
MEVLVMTKKGRGGRREGAGRPFKERPPTAKAYSSAEEYLSAVLAGTEPPDALRIAAAKALLPFQSAPSRAKANDAAPKEMRRRENQQAEAAARAAWRERSAAVRAKHGGA